MSVNLNNRLSYSESRPGRSGGIEQLLSLHFRYHTNLVTSLIWLQNLIYGRNVQQVTLPQFWVHNGGRIIGRSHLARSHCIVGRHQVVPHVAVPVEIAIVFVASAVRVNAARTAGA